jgi:hypothetical protein
MTLLRAAQDFRPTPCACGSFARDRRFDRAVRFQRLTTANDLDYATNLSTFRKIPAGSGLPIGLSAMRPRPPADFQA